MKKTLFTLIFLATAFAGLSLTGFAQTSPVLTATVPFSFRVENSQLPAGSYEIESVQSDPTILLIRRENGSQGLIVLSQDVQVPSNAKTDLVFDKIDGQYFLSEVRIAGHELGFLIPEKKQEREMVQLNTPNRQVG